VKDGWDENQITRKTFDWQKELVTLSAERRKKELTRRKSRRINRGDVLRSLAKRKRKKGHSRRVKITEKGNFYGTWGQDERGEE